MNLFRVHFETVMVDHSPILEQMSMLSKYIMGVFKEDN